MADEKKDDKFDLSKEGKEAVVALAKETYGDLVKPTAVEVGGMAGTIAATVSLLLQPLRNLVYEQKAKEIQFQNNIAHALQQRGVPTERLMTPSPTVAGPAIQGLMFADDAPEIESMYAGLLASAMDRETARKAHPSFAEILRQITPDEARIIRLFGNATEFPGWGVWWQTDKPDDNTGYGFEKTEVGATNRYMMGHDAKCQHLDLVPSYIDNIRRLGLVSLSDANFNSEFRVNSPNDFFDAAKHPDESPYLLNRYKRSRLNELPIMFPELLQRASELQSSHGDSKGVYLSCVLCFVEVSDFGKQFHDACVASNPLLNDPLPAAETPKAG